ncbi:MAG: type IX secretion system membrane protein PorP/SprF, partial [Elusimicrobiota bacterium]
MACLFAAIASHPTETAQAAFVPLGAGARGPGMGNAFTAVADDAHAVYYNPAGLALLSRPEFASSYTKLLMGLSDGSELGSSFLGYAQPIDGGNRGSLGTAWQSFSLNGGLYQENSFYLSYGRRFLEESGPGQLYGGASLKYLTRSFGALPEASNAMNGVAATGRADPVLSGRNSMGTPDADLGLLYRLKEHYALGLSLSHLTQPNVAFDKKDSDRLPLGVSLGFNYRGLLSNTALQYDTRRSPTGTRDQILTVAAERWLPGRFLGDLGFRGSLGMGTREFRQVTAGVSFRVRRLSVDYGFSMPLGTIASISGSHRLGFSLRFGAASEPEESMLMILEAMRSLKGGKVPELKAKGEGLSRSQKVTLDEHLAIARSLQSQAKYQAALDRLGQALTLSPADPGLLKDFGRLNFVARPIKELSDYKGDQLVKSVLDVVDHHKPL